VKLILVKREEAQARRGCSLSKQLKDEESGLFPPPVKRGRSVLIPEHELDAVLAAEVNGATEAELRALVKELVTKRKSFAVAAGAVS
jgi:hypothetical protein